jgi:hypothetical protein
MRVETESLKVVLTPDEKVLLSEQQAKDFSELLRLKDKAKEVSSQIKGQQEEVEARLKRVSGTIQNGYEYREVEVRKVTDIAAGFVRFYREDTGECFRERPIKPSERQGELGIEVGKEAPVEDGALKA